MHETVYWFPNKQEAITKRLWISNSVVRTSHRFQTTEKLNADLSEPISVFISPFEFAIFAYLIVTWLSNRGVSITGCMLERCVLLTSLWRLKRTTFSLFGEDGPKQCRNVHFGFEIKLVLLYKKLRTEYRVNTLNTTLALWLFILDNFESLTFFFLISE